MIEIDAWGFSGLVFDYAFVFFMTISALFMFLYFWWNRKLDFDEGPKYQMLREDEYEPR